MKSDIPGWMSERELDVILELAKEAPKNGVIVELGSYVGRSACAFINGSHPSVKIFCVDVWPVYDFDKSVMSSPEHAKEEDNKDLLGAFLRNIGYNKRVTPIKALSYEAELPDDIIPSLVFVDAGHQRENVRRDLEHWYKKLPKGGILSGHDYARFPNNDVCEVVDDFIARTGETLKLYPWTSIYRIIKTSDKKP